MDVNLITDAKQYFESFTDIFIKEGQATDQARQNARRKTQERFPISSRDIDLRESASQQKTPSEPAIATEYFSLMRDLNLSDGYSEAVASTLAYSKTLDLFREATPARGELMKNGYAPNTRPPAESSPANKENRGFLEKQEEELRQVFTDMGLSEAGAKAAAEAPAREPRDRY